MIGPGASRGLSALVSVFRYRVLIQNLVLKDLKLKYRDSLLGVLWSLLNPLWTSGFMGLPVKSYSGMCMRLRFAVQGRTIVLVSHDLEMVKKLCDRACLMTNGRIAAEGDPASTIERYHALVARPG